MIRLSTDVELNNCIAAYIDDCLLFDKNVIASHLFWKYYFKLYFCAGELAERSIAAVLKTVEGYTSRGSNP